MSIIQLHNGIFDLDCPEKYIDSITIKDVAYALANINRFQGRLKRQVSVAEHSCVQCLYILLTGSDDKYVYGDALRALLHDAAEMLTGDINGVFKDRHPAVLEEDSDLQNALFKHFRVPAVSLSKALAKDVDSKATICEGYLYCGGPYWEECWKCIRFSDRWLLSTFYKASTSERSFLFISEELWEELTEVLAIPATIRDDSWEYVFCTLYYWLEERIHEHSK